MRTSHSLAGLAAITLTVLPHSAISEDPERVGFIQFYNTGSYTIDNVWIKWKDGTETKQHRFTQNIAGGASIGYACYDLAKIKASDGTNIPDGAEVWLTAASGEGETKSCRKDTKKFYEQGSSEVLRVRMGGETYTNNRCKLGIKDRSGDNTHGNSNKC